MISIRNEEVEQLARKVAQKKGVTMTEAIRSALVQELKALDNEISLKDRLIKFAEEADQFQDTGIITDKAFFDNLQEVK